MRRGGGKQSKKEHKQKQMTLTLFQINKIITLKGEGTNKQIKTNEN